MQYRYDKPSYEFDLLEKDQSTKKVKIEKYQESTEVKNEHVYQQFMNDMYELIENGKCFNHETMEMLVIKNLLWKYNRTQVARITGLSVRTIRNKINKYGFKDIRIDNTHLQ